MKTCMTTVLAMSLLAVSCSKSDDKSDPAPVASVPAPTPTPTTEPTPAPEPVQGFKFVDAAESELPLFVRGSMNGWLGENVSDELLAASRLNYDETSGCYRGTLSLEAGEATFRLASYLSDADGNGWSHLKVGLGAAGTTAPLTLGTETKVEVYYFPAGDANGKDLGGGGNLSANFPAKGDYEFKFCTQLEDYTLSFLTISAK